MPGQNAELAFGFGVLDVALRIAHRPAVLGAASGAGARGLH